MGEWLTNPKFLDEHWMKELRMTCRQFCKLFDMLFPFIKKQDTNMRTKIPIDKAVTIALHRLGYGSTLYMVGHHLENLPSVSFRFTHNICGVLVIHFYNKYIQILEGEALQEIMASFESITGILYM
jgi:hypothetical protein